ncbi:hypothetical protein C6A77_12060 [Pseudomonas sp. AFG_SD02_1510_Pfu_092]|nr:hypothetical protein C6A77_12060 [Pseudomonas sp. AFG_SD02_1510_Pfu_092]
MISANSAWIACQMRSIAVVPVLSFVLPVLALSRVNPLPQALHDSRNLCKPCGSGFTRERAGPATARVDPRTQTKVPFSLPMQQPTPPCGPHQ